MLVPALLYKDEIEKASIKTMYDDTCFYDSANVYPYHITVSGDKMDDQNSRFEFAIITNDDKKLIGTLRYHIDWYNKMLYITGLNNLTSEPNPIIGFELYNEITRVVRDYSIHRMEFRMVGGNPIQKVYDKICKRLNGTKYILHDVFKDRYGEYHDEYIYEVIFD